MTDKPTIAIVPVKALAAAKGRLADVMAPAARRRLVAGMLHAVLDASARSPHIDEVLVVAGDADAAALAEGRATHLLVERTPGLDAALGAADAATAHAATTVVVAADLPQLRPDDLAAVFEVADGAQRVVVVAPTTDGGTGVLLRRPAGVITTAYGPGSAARHLRLARAAGVPALVVHRERIAHDVDTPAQLAALPGGVVACPPDPHAAPRLARDIPPGGGQLMPQGTVKYFDIETNTGTILLDDQSELPVDAATFQSSGLVELRLGQRVRFEVEGSGDDRRVASITLVSF